MAKAIINTARNQGKISKYIYGQFAEHLGRCIYEGLYVDENSDIPNKNGMRCDVVNALKELEIPVLRWPAVVLRTTITGVTVSAKNHSVLIW